MPPKLPSVAEAISDLSTLRFYAKTAVDGTLSGLHRSGLFGSSIEFAEHKPYADGDDLKHVDWKVYGRADKFYLKRFEDETNLRAYLVLDSSNSMNFGSLSHKKSEFATVLAATLAYMLIRQHDLVGMLQFGTEKRKYIPPRGRMPHFQILSEELHQRTTSTRETLDEALIYLRERIHKRAGIIVISDFLGMSEKTLKMAKMFRNQNHNMVWFHILDPVEIDFPFRDQAKFEGLEGEENIEANAGEVARAYRKEVKAWIQGTRDVALENHIQYRMVRTDESIHHVLGSVLA